MREALWKLLGVQYLLAGSVLIAMLTVGCTQNGGGDGQPSGGQTAVTEGGDMPAQEETTVGKGGTAQRTQGDSGQEETTQDQRQTQQRESAREERPSDQQQDNQQIVTVRITGTEGLSFVGRVGTAQDQRRIQGSVPEEYEIPFEGAAVTAALRKQEPQEGALGVEVVHDGEVVASRESSTSTGVVTVVWTPHEEQSNSGG